MEFYRNMCDGQLLAFYRAAKRSADSIKNMQAEITKMENEMSARKLDTDTLKPFKELSFYTSRLSKTRTEEYEY